MAESCSHGAVAQLGERLVCNQEATGSIPVSSTKIPVIANGGSRILWNPRIAFLCGQRVRAVAGLSLGRSLHRTDHAELVYKLVLCSFWRFFRIAGSDVQIEIDSA